MNPSPSSLSDADLLSAVVGFFLPLLIAILQQPRWPNWYRSLITVLVCLAVGTLTAYVQGNLIVGSILRRSLIIVFSALSTYQGFWKFTGARWIEQKTSGSTPAESGNKQ